MCICILAFWLALAPVQVFRVRTEGEQQILCSPVSAGDEILYLSVNSIYRVPVQERWRIESDGSLTTVEVLSAPAVMEYYGIEDFKSAGDGQVRAAPKSAHWSVIRLKVGPRGQQRLVLRDQEIALYRLVPEATVVIVSVSSRSRITACLD